jgi:hypothetical protein
MFFIKNKLIINKKLIIMIAEIKNYKEDKIVSQKRLPEEYAKGYGSRKWNFYSWCLNYKVSELNLIFGLR